MNIFFPLKGSLLFILIHNKRPLLPLISSCEFFFYLCFLLSIKLPVNCSRPFRGDVSIMNGIYTNEYSTVATKYIILADSKSFVFRIDHFAIKSSTVATFFSAV